MLAGASEEVLEGSGMMADHAASKAAVVVFTESSASRPVRRGVRADVLSPGPTSPVLARRLERHRAGARAAVPTRPVRPSAPNG